MCWSYACHQFVSSKKNSKVIFRACIKIHYIHPGTRISIYHCNFVSAVFFLNV